MIFNLGKYNSYFPNFTWSFIMPTIKISVSYDTEEFEIDRDELIDFIQDGEPNLDLSATTNADLIALLNETDVDNFVSYYCDPMPGAVLARLVLEEESA